MKKRDVKDLPHIAPEFNEKNPSILKEVSYSPFAASQTRYITAKPIHIKQDLDVDIDKVLIDTPGFNDTASPESI